MAWIEFHDDIWEHHKTEHFADLLGVSLVTAVGHLGSLWHFVLRNAWRDADLTPWGVRGIARAARWVEEPEKFVKAAQDCGFLEGFVVHGWLERAGKLVQDRLYNEQRRTDNADLRRKTASERRKADATVPNPTVPNPTNVKRPQPAPVAAAKPKDAPSAVDFTKGPLDAMKRREVETWLEDMRLPFDYGSEPDRIRRGVRVIDLPVSTCKSILDEMPRLGGKLRAVLQYRIRVKNEERPQGRGG